MDRTLWVGGMPNGLGEVKPHHYLEILRTAWENKAHPRFAWRILADGVCDGCALGTTGMRDFTMPGVHLCTVRLNLLKLNTMGPLDVPLLSDVESLRRRGSRALRNLGRLPYPMVRHRGDRGFRRVSWDEALEVIAAKLRTTPPDRMAFYVTSRGVTNETYYIAQKVARFLGTNNVDNSSRVCHAPSTTGMKQTLGVAASTCSYSDWIGTDLLVFFGSDIPNNQPVSMKYVYFAKRAGTQVLVVNPFREPGLERYWVPSVAESAVFGTKVGDRFYGVHTGGDIPFLNGVLRHLIGRGWIDEAFVREHTTGFDALKTELAAQSWETLERYSGLTRAEMLDLARRLHEARSAVFVWSMGITQHRFGVDNVKAIVNVALAGGFVGREKCGLMPIRGHSGVQGGAEVGCVPDRYPGGLAVDEGSAATLARVWRFRPPTARGMNAVEMIQRAGEGGLDVLYAIGGNFLETLPEPDTVERALRQVPLRVHQDIVVTKQMLVDGETVVLLPAATRYEQRGGGTETSTERRIYFSPEIPGRRIGEARSEWEILLDVATRAYPVKADVLRMRDAAAIREEIAATVPAYEGIQHLTRKGDAVQWGGPRLCEGGVFPMPDARARFTAIRPPEIDLPDGWFHLSSRRGKQFNSMVHRERDPMIGARREDVLMSEEDTRALGLRDGEPVLVRNDVGAFHGRCKVVRIKPRNVQMYWPEANAVIRRGVVDPQCGMPDYNALVQLVPGGVP
ncbi:MAG TPA: FdhF/YdeP family oxidoreductase [Thermoplasmata archaeon]|nr:FdhF/YdeP family oxidoreductase [Thermoplasmata archaeon]